MKVLLVVLLVVMGVLSTSGLRHRTSRAKRTQHKALAAAAEDVQQDRKNTLNSMLASSVVTSVSDVANSDSHLKMWTGSTPCVITQAALGWYVQQTSNGKNLAAHVIHAYQSGGAHLLSIDNYRIAISGAAGTVNNLITALNLPTNVAAVPTVAANFGFGGAAKNNKNVGTAMNALLTDATHGPAIRNFAAAELAACFQYLRTLGNDNEMILVAGTALGGGGNQHCITACIFAMPNTQTTTPSCSVGVSVRGGAFGETEFIALSHPRGAAHARPAWVAAKHWVTGELANAAPAFGVGGANADANADHWRTSLTTALGTLVNDGLTNPSTLGNRGLCSEDSLLSDLHTYYTITKGWN